jgi:TatA/E family protein of Tat protein translocase
MFGPLGVPELLLIFAVILIVFGPRKIPEIGRTLGKAMGEFRKATDELKNTIEREVRLEELKTIVPNASDFITPLEAVSRSEPSMIGASVSAAVVADPARVDESTSLPVVEEQNQPQSWPDGRTLDDASVVPDAVGQSYPVIPLEIASPGDDSSTGRLDDSSTRGLDDSTTVPDVVGQTYPAIAAPAEPLEDATTRRLDDPTTEKA